MNLVVDIGNTRTKLAVFENQKLLIIEKIASKIFLTKIEELFRSYPKISNAIISSVKKLEEEPNLLSNFCEVHVVSPTSKTPFKNKYGTPDTLGVDRIALVTAGFYEYPNKNTLIIDAGTCITYDILSSDGVYLGGAISPGLLMRYKAMHNQTDGLPLLQPNEAVSLIGNTTEDCMHSGVINGIVNEFNGVIAQYKKEYKDLTVILTGGDAHFFAKRLKNSIFANSKFLLEGLNYLLEYNKKLDD